MLSQYLTEWLVLMGKKITYKETIENLNILDYDYYFKIVDHALKQDIPSTPTYL